MPVEWGFSEPVLLAILISGVDYQFLFLRGKDMGANYCLYDWDGIFCAKYICMHVIKCVNANILAINSNRY